MVRYGQGAYIGLGEGTAFATDYTSAQIEMWFRTPEGADGLQMETDLIELESLESYDQDIDTVSLGQKRVTGSVTLKLTWSNAQNVLRWITGHNDTVDAAGAPSKYVYDFVPVDPTSATHFALGTVPKNLVIEVFRGDMDTPIANSVYYQGCVITEASFKFEPNSLVEVTLAIMGRGITISDKSTPVFVDNYMRTPTGQSTEFLNLDGAVYRCQSATLTITDPKEHRYEVSDQAPAVPPSPSGFRTVALDVDIEAPDTDATLMGLITDPVANRFAMAVVTVNEDVNNILEFNLINLVAKPPVEPRPSGVGVLRATLNLMCYTSGIGTPSYAVTLTNPDSDYV